MSLLCYLIGIVSGWIQKEMLHETVAQHAAKPAWHDNSPPGHQSIEDEPVHIAVHCCTLLETEAAVTKGHLHLFSTQTLAQSLF